MPTELERNGSTTSTFSYTTASLPLGESHAGGTLGGWAVTNTFDGNLRRATVAGTLSGAAQFTQGYGYDTAGRLQSATSGSFAAEYGYHANSPLVSTVSHRYGGNNRMVTTKQYDFINRLSSIANGAGDSHAYGYNAANQRTNVVRADGSYWVYAYDNLGQVTSGKRYWSDGTPVAGQQHEYVFDEIGNRTSAKSGGNSSGTGLRTETYTRNRLNQYTQKDEAATFDVLGLANASATVTVNGSSAYRKNEYFHREVSVSNGSAPVWQSVSTIASLGGSTTTNTGNMYVAKTPEVLTYDLDGNQLTDGRWSNTWDAENRLILQETIGTVPTGAKKRLIHEYDWMGRRIRKQVYNWVASAWSLVQDERFLYDGWNVIAILDSATTIQQTQLWGKDLSGSLQGAGGVGGLLAISHLPSSRTYFTGYDGNGNVTVLVDGVSGLTEGNFEYAPFGELIRASGTAVAVCPWRFSTKYEDAETGMLYYGYRFYNPSTGRWLSRDPINEYGGLNLFAFVQNNGLFWIDYLGLDDQSNGGQPIPHDAPKPLSKCTVTVVVGHNDKALDYALGIGGQKCAAVGAIACVSGKGPVNDLLAEGGLPVIEDYPVLPLFINPNIGKAKKGIFHNINKLYEDNLDSDDCVSTSTSICKPPQISYRDWEAMNGPQRYSSMLYATWMAADNHARRLCNENCCPQITIIFKFLPQKVLTKDSFFKDAVLHAGNSPTPLQPPNYEGKDELRWTVQCKQ